MLWPTVSRALCDASSDLRPMSIPSWLTSGPRVDQGSGADRGRALGAADDQPDELADDAPARADERRDAAVPARDLDDGLAQREPRGLDPAARRVVPRALGDRAE